MHVAYFPYSIRPNKTFTKDGFTQAVKAHRYKHGKNRSSVKRNMGPVTKLVVGNQPPLSVAFCYCNNI